MRLGAAALELIDQKIDISRWYPIAAFCELMDMDWELGGRRDPEYMRAKGHETCARFFEGGLYQQLDYARRADRRRLKRGPGSLLRQTRLITSVTDSLYNFLDVEIRIADDRLEIVYANAMHFTEALRYTTEGFMNEINRQRGSPRRWTSERTAPDCVVFTLAIPDWLRSP